MVLFSSTTKHQGLGNYPSLNLVTVNSSASGNCSALGGGTAGGGFCVQESRLDRGFRGWSASSRLWREGLFKVRFQSDA